MDTPTPPFAAMRRAQKLTQQQIAKRSGASQRFVSDLDRGACPRSIVLAAKVARTLGVTIDELFPDAADRALPERETDDGPEVDRSEEYAQPDAAEVA